MMICIHLKLKEQLLSIEILCKTYYTTYHNLCVNLNHLLIFIVI